MSLQHIRAALEQRLASMTPALPTAFENISFKPTVGEPYQRAYLLMADTENPTLDERLRVERGIFQVSLFYPTKTGPNESAARADLLRSHFAAGLVLSSGGYRIRVEGTPSVAPAMVDDDRFMVSVSIRFVCFIKD